MINSRILAIASVFKVLFDYLDDENPRSMFGERLKFFSMWALCQMSAMVDIFGDEQTFYFAFFTFTLATIVAAFILSRFITLNPSYHN